MKFKIFSSLIALGFAVTAGACGDDTNVDGNGGNGGTDTGGGGGDGGTIVLDGGGGSGPMGDGNDTLETAEVLEDAQGVQSAEGELNPPDTDIDYYQFFAVAGLPFNIQLEAVGDGDGAGVIDTFITVYDAEGNQIARNDDPPVGSTDSFLQFFVPEDGNYYVAVEEWCTSETMDPEFCNQAYFDGLSSLVYTLDIYSPDPAQNSFVAEEMEPNDTSETATVMEYEQTAMVGQYFVSIAYGEWQEAADADGMHFTVPSNLVVDPASRPQAWFHLVAPGEDNNGGSRNPGIVEVRDALSGEVLGRFDYSAETTTLGEREELQVPVAVSGQYLFVTPEGPAATGGTGVPYYFVWHGLFDGNPVETDDLAQNDLVTNAESLTEAEDEDEDVVSYFIEGDVALLPTADVDHFRVPVGAITNLYVACGGKTSGSGATLEVSVLPGDATTGLETPIATQIEDEELFLEDVDVSGEDSVIIRVENNQQVTGVTGAWYRCGVRFIAPTP